MVLPQRGQREFLVDAHVVPQFEQVQQPLIGVVVPQVTQPWPTAEVVVEVDVLLLHGPTSSKAQEDCGNRGRLKNSSQTFSANSSQGGIWQNP